MKYLCILFPHQNDQNNLDPLFNKISLDTDRWSPLFLSLWGKGNILKMNCFPRLNYLLQCLPIAIPQKNFKRFDQICKKFLWNGKRAWIKLERLQVPINKGVMGLPKLALYRYAFCLRHVAQWTLLPERAPPWFEIERRLFSPLAPIHALSSNIPSELKSHPIISNLYIVWKKFSKAFSFSRLLKHNFQNTTHN